MRIGEGEGPASDVLRFGGPVTSQGLWFLSTSQLFLQALVVSPASQNGRMVADLRFKSTENEKLHLHSQK